MKEGIRQRMAMVRQLLDEIMVLAITTGEKKKRRYTRRPKKPGPK